VDFALERPEHAALRAAYRDGAVVLTPNPHNHALLADKRNLTVLSDPAALEAYGLSPDMRSQLASIPRTVLVTPENADALWQSRKNLFFKPACGHGSKAVYCGDKVTRGVWAEITRGEYVAQAFAAPSARAIKLDGAAVIRKVGVRLYTYSGRILLPLPGFIKAKQRTSGRRAAASRRSSQSEDQAISLKAGARDDRKLNRAAMRAAIEGTPASMSHFRFEAISLFSRLIVYGEICAQSDRLSCGVSSTALRRDSLPCPSRKGEKWRMSRRRGI
jgi:hypothetical protein